MLPLKIHQMKESQETECDDHWIQTCLVALLSLSCLWRQHFSACRRSPADFRHMTHSSSGSDGKAAAPQWILGHRAILTHDRNGRGVFPRKCYIHFEILHYRCRICCYYLLFVSWLIGLWFLGCIWGVHWSVAVMAAA